MPALQRSAGLIPTPRLPRPALLGALVAIAVTAALDATSYTNFSAPGIRDTALFGPEVGLFGLALDALAVAALWRFSTATPARASQ